MAVPSDLLLLEDASRRRLLRRPRKMLALLRSRQVLRCSPAWAVTDNAWFMATVAAFDGTGFLPPFVPVDRNQDALFGMLLRMASPSDLIGHVPVAVAHEPDERRPADLNGLISHGKTFGVWECFAAVFDTLA